MHVVLKHKKVYDGCIDKKKKATCPRHPTNAHFYTKTHFVLILEDTFLGWKLKPHSAKTSFREKKKNSLDSLHPVYSS